MAGGINVDLPVPLCKTLTPLLHDPNCKAAKLAAVNPSWACSMGLQGLAAADQPWTWCICAGQEGCSAAAAGGGRHQAPNVQGGTCCNGEGGGSSGWKEKLGHAMPCHQPQRGSSSNGGSGGQQQQQRLAVAAAYEAAVAAGVGGIVVSWHWCL
jgi:hypothetical protein